MLGLILTLVMWILYPFVYRAFFFIYRRLLFFMISRLRVYAIIMAGWCSNRKYALLGTMRRIAQTISYEIRIAIFLLRVVMLVGVFRFRGVLMRYKV